ncbi:MAG: ABC transporter permease [Alphaproteobacteria bacterium]
MLSAKKIDFRQYGPLLALVALMIIGYLINPAFLSKGNLLNILTRSCFIAIIAVGMTFVITTGGIDLSVGSMAALIAGLVILFMNYLSKTYDFGMLAVIMGVTLAIILGIIGGFINGFISTKGGVEPFIITLGTMGIYRSVLIYVADGGAITLDSAVRNIYRPFYYGDILGIPTPIFVLIAVVILGYILLNYTRFGRYCAAIGSNLNVAKYSAIPVDKVRILTYMFLGLCVAIATIVYIPRLGSATSQTGVLWELEAIAAVVIGGTYLKGGHGQVVGAFIGALILTVIGNILNLTDVISVHLNGAAQGIIIIVAILLQRTQKS